LARQSTKTKGDLNMINELDLIAGQFADSYFDAYMTNRCYLNTSSNFESMNLHSIRNKSISLLNQFN
jgi:hypothetical protein